MLKFLARAEIVRYRIDGILEESFHLPKWIQDPLIARCKIVAKLDITERRVPTVISHFHFRRHFAAVGKLDGVADEIDEDLLEAAGISSQMVGDLRRDVPGQCESFFAVRELVRRVLAAREYHVLPAANGPEACSRPRGTTGRFTCCSPMS